MVLSKHFKRPSLLLCMLNSVLMEIITVRYLHLQNRMTTGNLFGSALSSYNWSFPSHNLELEGSAKKRRHEKEEHSCNLRLNVLIVQTLYYSV